MKFKEALFMWLLMLVNIAAGLVTLGLVAHLCWYCVAFGWFLLP